jgi:hypothetical protein
LARIPVALALWLAVAAGAAAAAAPPDWAALDAEDTVVVVTADADGSARETTVWLAVLDGAGYVRTGSTRWGDNAVRDGELVLRAQGASYPLRVELVEDDALRQRIADAFRAKYGWTDAMLSWMRGSRPKIMHLVPQPQE